MDIETRKNQGKKWNSYSFVVRKSVYRPGENPSKETIAYLQSLKEDELQEPIMRDRYVSRARASLGEKLPPHEVDKAIAKLEKAIGKLLI